MYKACVVCSRVGDRQVCRLCWSNETLNGSLSDRQSESLRMPIVSIVDAFTYHDGMRIDESKDCGRIVGGW